MAPDTMVVAVVAKESWKRKVEKIGPISSMSASTAKDPKAMKGFE
jgi:hypothetical protein